MQNGHNHCRGSGKYGRWAACGCGITQCYLPPDRGDIPAFTPSRSWYSIKRPRRDARLSWPSWPVTYRDGIPAHRQWRSQDFAGGGTEGLENGSPPAGSKSRAPSGWFRGGIASRKLIAVIKDIWLPNHAQFCVFSSTAQPGIFLW